MGKKVNRKVRSEKNGLCTLYVQGMHCNACELLIEKKLEKVNGVAEVQASLPDNSVTITFTGSDRTNDGAKLAELNDALRESGYSLSWEPIGRVVWDQTTLAKAMIAFLGLAIVYLFARSQGYLSSISISENSTLAAFFIFGLIAGVSSCAALVGGLLLSLSKQWNSLYGGKSLLRKSVPFSLFNIGRLVAYAFFGGLLGLAGSFIKVSVEGTSIVVIIVSVGMLIIGLQMLGVPWVSKIQLRLPPSLTKKMSSEENFRGRFMPFVAGMGTFFLPCGFTLLVQGIALTTGSFVTSALIMFLFALGTLPPLAAISFSSMKFQTSPRFASTYNLVTAVFIIIFGLYNINSQMLVLGLPNVSAFAALKSSKGETLGMKKNGLGSELKTVNGKQQQFAYMKATGFEYYPRSMNLKADVPTTLTIASENVVGCAQAMYLKGLYDQVVFLNKPTASVEFTPKKGTYYISCSMGMVEPVVVNVM